MELLKQHLCDAGMTEAVEANAELLISEAAHDLPKFASSTRLLGEVRACVHQCACSRLVHTPAVSFAALDRARGTLEDFSKTYLPMHGLEPADFVRFLPELTFVESLIYAMDEENEHLASHADSKEVQLAGWSLLVGVLEARGLLDEAVLAYLTSGQEYWKLERAICRAIRSHEPVDEADILRASELKSFDYRLLNFLLFKLREVAVHGPTVDFLSVDEQLTDIADDLFDYEDDVVSGSFNVYRGFVFVYGAEHAQGRLAAHISRLETRHASLLAALDEATQKAFLSRMDEVFARPGTRVWQIPAPIANEASYCADIQKEEQASDTSRRRGQLPKSRGPS